MWTLTKGVRAALRSVFLSGASLISIGLGGMPSALAQSDDAQSESTDVITVTGTRLRSNLSSPQPINTLDRAEFEASGNLLAAEALNELPQFGAGSGARSQNNNSLNAGIGFGGEFINLRNLGQQRTLVLVNGRRHVSGDPGSASVDLNMIPSVMVERLEVVTGAASAVYGADAVTGVVNVVLRENFEGVLFSSRIGVTDEGDGEEYFVSGLAGGAFNSGRGNVMFGAEYSKTQSILVLDRPFGRDDDGRPGDPANGEVTVGNGSSAVPGGRFTAANRFIDEGGVLQAFTSDDRYARWPHKYIQNPTERAIFSVSADYEALQAENLSATLYTELSYGRAHAEFQFEPTLALFQSGNFGTPNEAPFEMPRISADNPSLLAYLTTLSPADRTAIASTIDPVTGLNFQRRFSEAGQRRSFLKRDSLRFVGGVEGNVWDDWSYDLYYQFGRVDIEEDDEGTVSKNRLIAALDVDDNGTPGDLSDDTCADAFFRSLGCTPVNLFGPGTISQSQLGYLTAPAITTGVSDQHVVSGYVSGDLFDLPAGGVSAVVGGEYRKESVRVEPAQTLLEGSNLTKKLLGVEGGFDVAEVFGELNIPLIANAPFAELIEVSGAVRYSDYSTVSGQTSWSARGNWAVNDAIRVRGSYGTAIRAPNIRELFSPQSAAISSVTDPCDRLDDAFNPLPSLSGARQANCAAAISGFDDTFDQTQVQRQTVGNISEGNQNLDAEKATTFTAGIVFQPAGGVSGLALSADYFNIEIDNVISQLTLQNVINECYDNPGLPAVFCDQVKRDPATGQLISVNNTFLNAAVEALDGVDLALSYDSELARLAGALPGEIGLNVLWSHLFNHEFQQASDIDVDDRTGQVGDFKNRVNVNLNYDVGALGVRWGARFLSSALADTSQDLSWNEIEAVWYHDFQARLGLWNEAAEVAVGVKNITDKKPPIITGPARTSPLGEATASGVYDTRGRFFYVSVSARF